MAKTKTRRKTAKKRATKKKSKKRDGRKPVWELLQAADLEAFRTGNGLSKLAFAKKLGVTNSTYHNWVRGTSVPSKPAQQRLVASISDATAVPGPSASISSVVRRATATAAPRGRARKGGSRHDMALQLLDLAAADPEPGILI
ncbi:helix-turn-helix domain-containing protein, partial [Planctomycetota bacterium]|nr:helix-turn-helix domain-containing protein [Planctomycetota bacterium]